MSTSGVNADAVNIDETSCCLLPVHQIGWRRRGVKQAQLQDNSREPTTFTVAFSMDRARWTCWCTSCKRTGQTEHPHHPTLDDVMNPCKEGHAWILLWDMDSIHASEATLAAVKMKFPHVVLCFIPLHSTSYLQPSSAASRAASRRTRPRRLCSTALSTTS